VRRVGQALSPTEATTLVKHIRDAESGPGAREYLGIGGQAGRADRKGEGRSKGYEETWFGIGIRGLASRPGGRAVAMGCTIAVVVLMGEDNGAPG